MTERNALAELAERLKNGYVSLVVNGMQVATFATATFPELDKAQRIIAELAKSDIGEIYMAATLPKDGRVIQSCIDEAVWNATDTVNACRAIAEEGASNEK